ncbi:hypothetical protein HJC22_41075 [Corallococcus exiguus]|uniref:hypothetical protein n=1 Tax=Corallococcus TaxID=83461 RepID=UPI000EEC7429|nr:MULTISPECIES: hypothetical protein [Corallococcus]NNC22104.1 hypothetical protein [Corallococcus exiguus]RKI02956.1 hypothetical protein D7Y15_34260 [Corallococcus sp. AB030]
MASFARPWLLVAVLSSSVMGCATMGGAQGKDLVTLRYAWPEQSTIRVHHTVDVRTDWSGRQTAHRRYTMRLGPVDEEGRRRLVFQDVEIIEAPFPAFVEPLAASIIDAQGDFQGIDPLEDGPGQDLLDALPVSPKKKAQMAKALSNGLEQEARNRWNEWVGIWHGSRLNPGRTEVVPTTMSVGTGRKKTEEVPAEERVRLDVGVPCSDAVPEPKCVKLKLVRVPIGQTDETKGRYAHVELELVTDPETLQPYSSRVIRMDRVDWNGGKGEPDFHEAVHVEQHTFIHGVEGPPGQVAAAQSVRTSRK